MFRAVTIEGYLYICLVNYVSICSIYYRHRVSQYIYMAKEIKEFWIC